MITIVMKTELDEVRMDLEKQFSQFFDKLIQVRSVYYHLNYKGNNTVESPNKGQLGLGPGILSLVRRLVSLGGQPIFSLKMP